MVGVDRQLGGVLEDSLEICGGAALEDRCLDVQAANEAPAGTKAFDELEKQSVRESLSLHSAADPHKFIHVNLDEGVPALADERDICFESHRSVVCGELECWGLEKRELVCGIERVGGHEGCLADDEKPYFGWEAAVVKSAGIGKRRFPMRFAPGGRIKDQPRGTRLFVQETTRGRDTTDGSKHLEMVKQSETISLTVRGTRGTWCGQNAAEAPRRTTVTVKEFNGSLSRGRGELGNDSDQGKHPRN